MFSLQVLHEIESTTEPLSRETTAVLNKVLSIAEQVLSWEFIQRILPFEIYLPYFFPKVILPISINTKLFLHT